MNPTDITAAGSLAIAAAAFITSILTYRGAVRAASRPVLVFAMTGPRSWQVRNVGAGPVVRLVISDLDSRDVPETVTNCHPLGPGSSLDITWHKLGTGLLALYEDIHGKSYSTTCRMYVNTLSKERRPDWSSETEQWLQQQRPESPSRPLLETKMLRGKTAGDLDRLRGEFYARRGYRFTTPDLSRHFEQFDWYEPAVESKRDIESQFPQEDEYDTRLVYQYMRRNGMDVRDGAL